jgi:hypothetical protein
MAGPIQRVLGAWGGSGNLAGLGMRRGGYLRILPLLLRLPVRHPRREAICRRLMFAAPCWWRDQGKRGTLPSQGRASSAGSLCQPPRPLEAHHPYCSRPGYRHAYRFVSIPLQVQAAGEPTEAHSAARQSGQIFDACCDGVMRCGSRSNP